MLTRTGACVREIVQARAAWDPELRVCVVKDTALQRDTMLVDLACQLSLLVIMFVGVLRMRAENGLWRVLYHQVRARIPPSECRSLRGSLNVLLPHAADRGG